MFKQINLTMKKLPYLITTFILCVFVMNSNAQFDCFKSADGNSINFGAGSAPAGPASQIEITINGTSFKACKSGVIVNPNGSGSIHIALDDCFNDNTTNYRCRVVQTCTKNCPISTNPPPVTGGTGIKKACWKKNVGGVKRFEMYQMENTNLKDQIIRVTDGTSFSGCLFDVDFTNGTGFGQLSETQYQCFPNSNNFQCEIVSSCSGGCTEGANPNPPPTNGNISVLKDYPTPEQDPTCGMYIGAAATTLYQDHEETNYLETFKDNFNMVVPEVGMKMDFLKPDGTFNPNNFALQAEVDGLAGKNTDDLIVRGHTISWHGGKKMIKDNQPNHCFNNVQDGNETGKNCGGSCAPCHCFNKIQDGNEQRIDCGGSCVPCRDSNNPNYLKGMTNSQLENELRGYIAQMMNSMNSKYKIESWDVVNEAFRGIDPNSPHGPFRTFAEIQGDVSFHGGVEDNRNFNGAANGIPCIWEKLGYSNIEFEVFGTRHKIPNYIIIAFQEAAKHRLPGQALVYNDWGAEILGVYGNKAEYQFQMIKKLRTINTPEGQPIIDGVGFQCHFDVDFENPNALPAHRGPSPNRIDQNRINQFGTVINKYTSDPITQNMKIYFSEVDIALPIERTNQDRINQKEAYRLLVDFAASIPQTEAFVTWGLADDFSWIGANKEPLLFKKKFKNNNQFEKFEAKAAYFEALNALKAASCNTNKLIGYFDNEVEPIFTAYPNPFDQTIQIDLEEGNGEMKIYDMTGRTMLSQSINSNQTNVNTERLKAGYYLIEVESNGETQTQKIIKH